MRIALIYTETDKWALGIRSVSVYLKRAGHSTRLILMGDGEGRCSEKTLAAVGGLVADADAVGLSCFSRGSDRARQVAAYLRSLGKFTIWGGIHATLNPEDCVPLADAVCRGEGEETMRELLDRLATGRDWRDVRNVAYRGNGGACVQNSLRPLIDDLDDLPVPDYSFADEYHLTDAKFVKKSGISDVTEPIMFIGSRGCYYHCTYCSNTRMKELYAGTGNYVRKMSIGKYIEHAASLRDAFPQAKFYYFIDEDFFARPPEELRRFADEYREKIGMPFDVLASPLQATQEKIDLLVQAGLWRVRMGVESGSERTKQEIYRRPMTNAAVKRAAAAINRHAHLVPFYFVIISNPYEEKADLIETIRFLADLSNPYYLQAFNLVFFPGSALYDRAVRDGIIAGKQDSGYRLDYRGGLNHEAHSWKKKNLYLNGLIYLMEGKSTASRLGLVPRRLVPWLIEERTIAFHDRYPGMVKAMIALKMLMLSLRKQAAWVITKCIGDPKILFNLRTAFKNR